MKSIDLLRIMDGVFQPRDILSSLNKENFGITDITEDGDSVLHVFATSKIAKSYQIANFLNELTSAGADVNAMDRQGKDFLSCVLEHANFFARKEVLEILLKNKNFDVNKTAIRVILSDTQIKDRALVTALINHDQCKIDTLDKDGNNYLQLAIISCQHYGEEIAELLIQKKIDISHKNHAGKSAFDLVIENTAKRSDYLNNKLLISLLKSHPSAVIDRDSNGMTILGMLLKGTFSPRGLAEQLELILKAYQKTATSTEPLKSAVSDQFNYFRQKAVTEEAISALTKAIAGLSIDVDIEYCIALTAIANPSLEKGNINNNLKSLGREINVNVVINYVKQLTKENSVEQSIALRNVFEVCFQLDCFDDAMLSLEEQYLYNLKSDYINQDWIRFGHLFSLSDSLPVDFGLTKLTGSNYFNTAPFMAHLINAYVSHCETTGKHTEHLDAIKQVRNMSIKAMRLNFLADRPLGYYPGTQLPEDSYLSSAIRDSKKGVEVYTGWSGHAINIIFQGDDLYRNNGGGCSADTTTEHYKMTKPENLSKDVFTKLYRDSYQESNKPYIQHELHDILGLKFVGAIDGKFQTVGNCSFESLRIALKVKYGLFLPKEIADKLFTDTVEFFEQFYLEEFISRYSTHSTLPHILMRLIIQKLIPDEKFELAGKLLKEHFASEANQEIMQVEFMLKRWRLITNGGSTEQYDRHLTTLGVVLNPQMNKRLQILDRFLNNTATSEDLSELQSWSLDKQIFQGEHVLHIAVMNDNLPLALSIIEMFPTAVHHKNWRDEEPLCLVKSVEMINLLVKAGAKTDRTNYDNPLDHAINANRHDLVMALLQHGAKTSEYSASYAAARDPEILMALIEHDPEAINIRTHDYRTPVHAAARKGNTRNIRNLVYYGGANPDAPDVNGATPLQLALCNGHNDAARALIECPSTLFGVPHRGDPVVNMTKDVDMQRMILQKEQEKIADLAHFEIFKQSNPGINNEHINYLIIAIRKNDVAAIRGCLLAYPDIKVVNYSKFFCDTPLAVAIQNLAQKKGKEYEDGFAVVQLLLKTSGININARMSTTEPILFMATSIGDVRVLELFLADPALELNAQDDVGYTALHDAVERGHLDCVRRLLEDERIDSSILNTHKLTAAEVKSFKYRAEDCRNMVLEYQNRTGLIASNY